MGFESPAAAPVPFLARRGTRITAALLVLLLSSPRPGNAAPAAARALDTVQTWFVDETKAKPPYATVGKATRPVLFQRNTKPTPGKPFKTATGVEVVVSQKQTEVTATVPAAKIPAGATLRVALGLASTKQEASAVRFRITAEAGGKERQLFERVVDPKDPAGAGAWTEVRVPLTNLADTETTFRFQSSAINGANAARALWGDPMIVVRAAGQKPNIVLVSLDTLRAKSTSVYGAERDTTPKLAAMAKQGAVFDRAFTTYSNTMPSHMSLFTGLYPKSHQVYGPAHPLSPEVPQVAELLRDAGYLTAAFTENGFLIAPLGFRRGFSVYYENKKSMSGPVGPRDATETFGAALDWVKRNPNERFFVFAHTYQVHAPYEPPEEYASLFEETPEDDVERNLLRYEQEARYLDDTFADFLDGLRKARPGEEFLTIVVADHGEEFLEHGFWQHAQVYDEVLQIPLILHWPGKIPAGVRVGEAASLIDVLPTLLTLINETRPAVLDGQDLTPFLQDPEWRLDRPAIFAEAGSLDTTELVQKVTDCIQRGGEAKECSTRIDDAEVKRKVRAGVRTVTARARDYKCILERGRDLKCFDLVKDPGEKNPLPADDHEELSKLRDALEEYRQREPLRSAHPPKHVPKTDEATRQKLKALGYVDDTP